MNSLTKAIALATMIGAISAPAWAGPDTARAAISDPTTIWSAWGGGAEFKIHRSIPQDMQLEISAGDSRRQGNSVSWSGLNLGSLEFHAPQGQFEDFLNGAMAFDAPMTFERLGNKVSFDRLFIEPLHDGRYPMLQLRDDQGRVLFYARQIHVFTDNAKQRLVMERMDIHMTEALALLLGEPLFTNQYLGELELEANLNIPAGAQREVLGGTCAERPKWPTQGFRADVGLTDMGFLQDTGQVTVGPDTFEIITPSSSLKNLEGLDGADVPWYRKFMGDFPPHNNDQHPYLIWNMYRFVDNRMEQIGVSGLKHAFLTINVNCTLNCGNSHILWPGCEDVYGIGNNDSDGDLGPRHEVNPRTGVFDSTGSFFDQNGDGVMDNSSSGNGENRMRVLRSDMQVPGAEYYFESWYIVRDDVDIFNSMGYHPVTPNNTSGNNWAYQLDAFKVGAVLDNWVSPSTDPATGSQNVTYQDLANDMGHFKLAVRTEDLGNGNWRYNYTMMNYDIEHGVTGISFPGFDGVTSSVLFHDPDQDAGNDWVAGSSGGSFGFNAPAANPMNWGTAYTFSFVAEGAPPVVQTIEVSMGAGAPQSTVTVDILAPGTPDLVLLDGFEG